LLLMPSQIGCFLGHLYMCYHSALELEWKLEENKITVSCEVFGSSALSS
jgi:hypothetical protein